MTFTLLDEVREKSKWGRYYKEMPRFTERLRIFGEVGVVWDYRNQKTRKN